MNRNLRLLFVLLVIASCCAGTYVGFLHYQKNAASAVAQPVHAEAPVQDKAIQKASFFEIGEILGNWKNVKNGVADEIAFEKNDDGTYTYSEYMDNRLSVSCQATYIKNKISVCAEMTGNPNVYVVTKVTNDTLEMYDADDEAKLVGVYSKTR